MSRKMGGKGRCTRAVNMGNEDEGPALGNQARLYQGMAEEHPNRNDQQILQPGHSVERGDPSTRTLQSTSRNGTCDVLPDGRQANGPVSHGARVRVVFEELGGKAQKELLVDLAQDFA